MNRYQKLMSRIEQGEQILIDGATGTEVERRGVPVVNHAWNSGGALTHPDLLRDIHLDYLDTGAEIIISNTFATGRNCLQDAGGDWETHFELLNRRGVELAIEARDLRRADDVLVAAGVSHWDFNNNPPTLAELRANTIEQVEIMKSAGPDLFMLEMMADIDKMRVILDVTQRSGLPVWAGLSFKFDENNQPVMLHKGTVEDAVTLLLARDVPLLNVMHTEVRFVDATLDVLDGLWKVAGRDSANRPLGVYAHSGKFKQDSTMQFDTVMPADMYSEHCVSWLNRGVQVIGGCCGLGVEHMEQVQAIMPK